MIYEGKISNKEFNFNISNAKTNHQSRPLIYIQQLQSVFM